MEWDPTSKPKLRPIEAFPVTDDGHQRIGLRDRSGLSEAMLTISRAVLFLLAQMDGDTDCETIRRQFQGTFGQPLPEEALVHVVEQLERAHMLEGPGFESYYQSRQDAYRRDGTRVMPHAALRGIPDDSGTIFREMLAGAPPVELPGPARGLIAPHLDYPRGRPCYAAAYAAIRNRPAPSRVVILGTNHFGRSTGPVATASAFATPFGRTQSDVAFLERLESQCGFLRTWELDHAREHSVELQVAWLQFLFGAEAFELVAVLCPDPCCGPTGEPSDGNAVGWRAMAKALGGLIEQDGRDTLVVAGADLSHVGTEFGDQRDLDEEFLGAVRRRDREALAHLEAGDATSFVAVLAEDGNSTRVCSAGCMAMATAALSDAKVSLLGYHQAVDPEAGTCVSCAALAFV